MLLLAPASHMLASCSPQPVDPCRQEQAEVEQYYIRAGYLFPTFYEHEFYWFGHRTTPPKWPAFEWMDPTVQRRDK